MGNRGRGTLPWGDPVMGGERYPRGQGERRLRYPGRGEGPWRSGTPSGARDPEVEIPQRSIYPRGRDTPEVDRN